MSKAHCAKFPKCMNVGENATVPRCAANDCPGRTEKWPNEMCEPKTEPEFHPILLAEQWQPGKAVMGVCEVWHDPGDGSTKSSGFGVLGDRIVKPGDYIITTRDGHQIVVREVRGDGHKAHD